MKKIYYLIPLFILIISCSQNNKKKQSIKIEETVQETQVKKQNTIELDKEIISEKKISDLEMKFSVIDKEQYKGLIYIKNKKTNSSVKVPIQIMQFYDDGPAEYEIVYEDLDFDNENEIIIKVGNATYSIVKCMIYDYKSLKPKNLFKYNKNATIITPSKKDKPSQYTNTFRILKADYIINKEKENFTIYRGSGIEGVRETYKFSNGFYHLESYGQIYEGKEVKTKTYYIEDHNAYLLDNLLKFNSQQELINKYGKKNVNTDIRFESGMIDIEPVEGMTPPYSSILFPNTKNEVVFIWHNKKELKNLQWIEINKENSEWQTKDNIKIGSPTNLLEKVNGRSFAIRNFTDDYEPGMVDWKKGYLENRIITSLKASSNTPKRFFTEGKKSYNSSSVLVKYANITVRELILKK